MTNNKDLQLFLKEVKALHNSTLKAASQHPEAAAAFKEILEVSQSSIIEMFKHEPVLVAPPVSSAPPEAPAPSVPPASPAPASPPASSETPAPPKQQKRKTLLAKKLQEEETLAARPPETLATSVYALHIEIPKSNQGCAEDSICHTSKSRFCPNCGVTEIKRRALALDGDNIHAEVQLSPEKRMTFAFYHEGTFLGNMATSRDNKDIVDQLEKYIGSTVVLNVRQKPATKLDVQSRFTNLHAEIVGPIQAPPVTQDSTPAPAPSSSGSSLRVGKIQTPKF